MAHSSDVERTGERRVGDTAGDGGRVGRTHASSWGGGELGELDELNRRYGAACLTLARFITGDRFLGEDAVYEALLAGRAEQDSFDPDRTGLRSRLILLTRDRANRIARAGGRPRRSAAECERLLAEIDATDPADATGPAGTPHRDSVPAISTGLQRLTAQQRRALALSYLGAYQRSEVAAESGVSPDTVCGWLVAAVRQLARSGDTQAPT